MSNLDSMLERNKEFAAEQSAAGTLMPSLPKAMPNVKALVIGCADMRVDPDDILGAVPGELVVLRNIGGPRHAWIAGANRDVGPRWDKLPGKLRAAAASST